MPALNPKQPRVTYEIATDGKSILCRVCCLRSHHPTDVAERYCNRCKRFHDGYGAELDARERRLNEPIRKPVGRAF